VLVSFAPDPQTAVVQLEAGAVDMVGYGLPVVSAAQLESDPRFQVLHASQTGQSWNLVANCRVDPTSNKIVRQALNYALNRQRIADTAWRGHAVTKALPWAARSPAYDAHKNQAYGFDLEKARSLLTSAGVSELTVDLSWPTSLDFATSAQIYQADLASIGVSAMLKPLAPAVFLPALVNGAIQGLAMVPSTTGRLQPASTLRQSVQTRREFRRLSGGRVFPTRRRDAGYDR
jgi:peptide/nickel transport system substrate-binding protein